MMGEAKEMHQLRIKVENKYLVALAIPTKLKPRAQ